MRSCATSPIARAATTCCPAAARERAPVDWLLDAVATTLRPACREVDAPAYGFRPQRGIGAEAPRPERRAGGDRGHRAEAGGVLAPARRRRLCLPRALHGGRLRRDAVALAPAARGRAGRATPGWRPGSRRSARTPRGHRSRPRAGSRRDHEPRQQPRQGRARARRGQGARSARASSSTRARTRCAPPWPRASRRSRCSSTTTSAATASPTSSSPRARRCCAASGEVMAALSIALVTRAGPSACCAPTTSRRSSRDSPASAVGLHLHGVADPGNLGTLLRSAQGFGPAHVALAEGCADPLSPRAVRASMGALYSVPVITLRRGAAAARDRPGRPRRADARRARPDAPGRVRAGRRAHGAPGRGHAAPERWPASRWPRAPSR